jgi:sugar-specific transcriptional regulator TrmB
MSVSEISKLAEIPRSNAYEALEKLLMKGMVISIPGKNKKYAASDPETFAMKILDIFNVGAQDEMAALERKIKELQDLKFKEIDEKKVAIKESLNNIVSELESLYKKGRGNDNPLDYIEILKDPYQADRLFLKYFNECKEEAFGIIKQRVDLFTNPVHIKNYKEQIKTGINHIKRGISVKSIYEIYDDPENNKILCKEMIDKFVEAGEQVRVKPNLPMRMAVFDNSIVIFTLIDPLAKDDKSTTVQIVKHPVFAQSFRIMFDALWNQSEEYNEYKKRMKIS